MTKHSSVLASNHVQHLVNIHLGILAIYTLSRSSWNELGFLHVNVSNTIAIIVNIKTT